MFIHSRYLFWTEWGQIPCIAKARLDGSEKVVLVGSGISWPNGISIDHEVSEEFNCYIIYPHLSNAIYFVLRIKDIIKIVGDYFSIDP